MRKAKRKKKSVFILVLILAAAILLVSDKLVPMGSHRIEVPYVSQNGILPNGCEAVSATMLLNYWGDNIGPEEFSDRYLEKDEVYFKDNVMYGPNPAEVYAGDPKSERYGWGCFAPVITDSIEKRAGDTLKVKNLTGTSLDMLCARYIRNDIPVAIWIVQGMNEVQSYYSWKSYDGTKTYEYPVRQHCVVLTGYDREYYYINDPINGQDIRFEKTSVKASYNSMGKQAVAINA